MRRKTARTRILSNAEQNIYARLYREAALTHPRGGPSEVLLQSPDIVPPGPDGPGVP